ncbi:MAG: hypothetical protein AAGI53_10480 [Planctomycetota bacterium]
MIQMLPVVVAAFSLTLQPAPDFLRGPRILEGDKPSLVAKTMTGKMEILRGRPEIAAVDLINIPAEVRAQAVQLEADRLDFLSRSMIEHIDVVAEITDLNVKGRGEEAKERLTRLREVIEPDRERDVLLERVVDVIGDEHEPELRRIVDEYWDALVDRRLANSGVDPEDAPERRRVRVRERLERDLFNREIRRAYDQSLKPTRDALQAIYGAVEPTDEQRERIREIVLKDFKRTGPDRTPADRRATMRRIYDTLDADRRAKLFDYAIRVIVPNA